MSRKQQRQMAGRMCGVCRRPSGRRKVCALCSPRRRTRQHIDKYARPAAA